MFVKTLEKFVEKYLLETLSLSEERTFKLSAFYASYLGDFFV